MFKRIIALIGIGIVVGIVAPVGALIPLDVLFPAVLVAVVGTYATLFTQDMVALAVIRIPRFTTVEARRAQMGLAA